MHVALSDHRGFANSSAGDGSSGLLFATERVPRTRMPDGTFAAGGVGSDSSARITPNLIIVVDDPASQPHAQQPEERRQQEGFEAGDAV